MKKIEGGMANHLAECGRVNQSTWEGDTEENQICFPTLGKETLGMQERKTLLWVKVGDIFDRQDKEQLYVLGAHFCFTS